MKILIVEDEQVSAEYLNMILKPYGVLESANDGQEAVELFHNAHLCHQPFDLIFMDIVMPVMDGLMATDHIRRWERDNYINKEVAIIIETALSMNSRNLSQYLKGGDMVLPKPFKPQQVKGFMAEFGFDPLPG